MPKLFEGKTEDGKPLCNWKAVYGEAAKLRKFAIKVLTETEYITERQRRWYRGICLPFLAARNDHAETIEWWDQELKKECKGLSLLKKEIFFIDDAAGQRIGVGRLSIKGVGKKNMTAFIDEILSKSNKEGWGLTLPDKDLRKST